MLGRCWRLPCTLCRAPRLHFALPTCHSLFSTLFKAVIFLRFATQAFLFLVLAPWPPMRFVLLYRQSRHVLQLPPACCAAAAARYESLQSTPEYVEQLWSPTQWNSICNAFEADFQYESHVESEAVFRIQSHHRGKLLTASLPAGFCFTATLLLETFLARNPDVSLDAAKTHLLDAPLFGDLRFPALRYRRKLYTLSRQFAVPDVSPLLSTLAESPQLHTNLVPPAFFQVLWAALQTQCLATAETLPFLLRFQRHRCRVAALHAFDAAPQLFRCVGPVVARRAAHFLAPPAHLGVRACRSRASCFPS